MKPIILKENRSAKFQSRSTKVITKCQPMLDKKCQPIFEQTVNSTFGKVSVSILAQAPLCRRLRRVPGRIFGETILLLAPFFVVPCTLLWRRLKVASTKQQLIDRAFALRVSSATLVPLVCSASTYGLASILAWS